MDNDNILLDVDTFEDYQRAKEAILNEKRE